MRACLFVSVFGLLFCIHICEFALACYGGPEANRYHVSSRLKWNEEQTRGLVCQQSVCERDGRERCHFVFGILCK